MNKGIVGLAKVMARQVGSGEIKVQLHQGSNILMVGILVLGGILAIHGLMVTAAGMKDKTGPQTSQGIGMIVGGIITAGSGYGIKYLLDMLIDLIR
ncbi:hypothetical protein [Bulleidia sp. zg-1006]|uniref:hypothetical protein n=1 Tax=Bulleidia sp. zg-1006 TaxID=2806552 RepID=UPI001939B78C|nr:hypothetical protein [Bulleidia sp. zg-1006]QRG86062.1 hypothetical protein JOS54_04095 [Bulleidia sp. zg-1006]